MEWLLLAAVFVVLVVAIFRGGGPPPPLIGHYVNSPPKLGAPSRPPPSRPRHPRPTNPLPTAPRNPPPPSGSKVRRYAPEGAVDSRVRGHTWAAVNDTALLPNCRCVAEPITPTARHPMPLLPPPPTAKLSDFERAVLDEINWVRLFGYECQHVGTDRNDDGQLECIACGQVQQKPRPLGPVWQ